MPDTPKAPPGHVSFQHVESVEVAAVGIEMVGFTVAFRSDENSRAEELPETVRFVLPCEKAEQFAQLVLSKLPGADRPQQVN